MPTAAEIIKHSFEIACILDPEEEVEGYYQTTGLRALNDIIAQWSSLPTYLQTYHNEVIDVLQGVYQYTVSPTIIQVMEGNLLDSQNVLSFLYNIDLKRQNTLNYALSAEGPSRPQLVYAENVIENVPPETYQNPTTLWFFPVPDQDYTATLRVKKKLGELTQSQLITEVSTAYLMPLKYQIAMSLHNEYSSVVPDSFYTEYDRLMQELKAANKMDMTVINSNPFSFHGRRYRPWSSYAS